MSNIVTKKWAGLEPASSAAVQGALTAISRELSPMSATGGWLRTMMIVRATGLDEVTVRERLTELEDLGRVERRRFGSAAGGGGYQWRLR